MLMREVLIPFEGCDYVHQISGKLKFLLITGVLSAVIKLVMAIRTQEIVISTQEIVISTQKIVISGGRAAVIKP